MLDAKTSEPHVHGTSEGSGTSAAALVRRIRGHFNYFGVSGNYRSLRSLINVIQRLWFKWLCRRSQRTRLHWERFRNVLERFPLPTPQIRVQFWSDLA